MILIVVMVVDCCLQNVWEFCGSDGGCGDTDCCTCGDDASVDVSGLSHTVTIFGSVSVIIIEVNSFSQDAPPQQGNLSLE
jgi:hypothetical protein